MYKYVYVCTLKCFAANIALESVEVFAQFVPEWHFVEQMFPSFLHEHCLETHSFLQLQVTTLEKAFQEFIL